MIFVGNPILRPGARHDLADNWRAGAALLMSVLSRCHAHSHETQRWLLWACQTRERRRLRSHRSFTQQVLNASLRQHYGLSAFHLLPDLAYDGNMTLAPTCTSDARASGVPLSEDAWNEELAHFGCICIMLVTHAISHPHSSSGETDARDRDVCPYRSRDKHRVY